MHVRNLLVKEICEEFKKLYCESQSENHRALVKENQYKHIVIKYRTTMTPKVKPNELSAWKRLKGPALFGIGLYIGLAMFGDRKEEKKEATYLEELRSRFRQ